MSNPIIGRIDEKVKPRNISHGPRSIWVFGLRITQVDEMTIDIYFKGNLERIETTHSHFRRRDQNNTLKSVE